MRQIRRAIVHHSASSRETTTLEQIREWHLARRFRDVGYHYVIEARGQIRHGRSIQVAGAHAKGHNSDSIGICLVGDNTKPGEHWSLEQLAALRELIDALRLVWPELQVCGHRDCVATLCPGVDVVL